jgi:hypothetical protein
VNPIFTKESLGQESSVATSVTCSHPRRPRLVSMCLWTLTSTEGNLDADTYLGAIKIHGLKIS